MVVSSQAAIVVDERGSENAQFRFVKRRDAALRPIKGPQDGENVQTAIPIHQSATIRDETCPFSNPGVSLLAQGIKKFGRQQNILVVENVDEVPHIPSTLEKEIPAVEVLVQILEEHWSLQTSHILRVLLAEVSCQLMHSIVAPMTEWAFWKRMLNTALPIPSLVR